MTLKHQWSRRSVVERCHELGVAVLVWTVNDRALFRRLDALGVDGVITRRSPYFLPAIARRKASAA